MKKFDYIEYIMTQEPSEIRSSLAEDYLTKNLNELSEEEKDKLIEIIVSAEDGPWRAYTLITWSVPGALRSLSWPQYWKLAKAAKLATDANKPDWLKALQVAFPNRTGP